MYKALATVGMNGLKSPNTQRPHPHLASPAPSLFSLAAQTQQTPIQLQLQLHAMHFAFWMPQTNTQRSGAERGTGGARGTGHGARAEASAGHEIILKRPQNDFIQLKCQKRCLFSLFNAINIYTFIYAAAAATADSHPDSTMHRVECIHRVHE